MSYKRTALDTPTDATRRKKRINLDGDSVGRVAESIARFLGTGKYLFYHGRGGGVDVGVGVDHGAAALWVLDVLDTDGDLLANDLTWTG